MKRQRKTLRVSLFRKCNNLPATIVLSKALSQYAAYFPHSVLFSAFLCKCNFKNQSIIDDFGTNKLTANASNCQPWRRVKIGGPLGSLWSLQHSLCSLYFSSCEACILDKAICWSDVVLFILGVAVSQVKRLCVAQRSSC